jgi:hypothetical protein
LPAADHLGEPFNPGALLIMQVLEQDAPVSIGTLYILDDGSDVASVRLQGESPDLWIVDRFSGRWRLAPLRPGPAPMAPARQSQSNNFHGPTQPRSTGPFLPMSTIPLSAELLAVSVKLPASGTP